MRRIFLILFISLICIDAFPKEIPLFWWRPSQHTSNFGDELSRIVVEKMIERKPITSTLGEQKLLGIGSILHFAQDQDVIWGSGVNGKIPVSFHTFSQLDVRAVRGPLTRKFLLSRGIECPEIYGDPALLLSRLFPGLKPSFEKDYIVIPNLNEIKEYSIFKNVILPTLPPMEVIKEILQAKFVISGSLHGIIVAESFGIPARMLRITEKESLFKYKDYYLGSGRPNFKFARSIKEALKMGGETLPVCDLDLLERSFPYDYF